MFKIFRGQPIVYGISRKEDGNMHLACLESNKNRAAFFQNENLSHKKIFSAGLAHKTSVAKVEMPDGRNILPGTDALTSADKNLLLTITVADCFPVYFFDRELSIIGLAHCGWRGTVANLAEKVVTSMGSKPKNLLAGIGPGIQGCHFEIQSDIMENFKKYSGAITVIGGKIFINLPKIITHQLLKIGLGRANIESTGDCTFENPTGYFSFRRDKPKAVEAMVAYIGLA